jgi:hypothetical protein
MGRTYTEHLVLHRQKVVDVQSDSTSFESEWY